MSSLPQTCSPSRPKPTKSPLTIFPADMMAELRECRPEEVGLLMQLRAHAWYHGGVENSEQTLLRLFKSFQVSAQKFRKLWPFLSTFFTEIDGFLFYTSDEERRIEAEERTSKLQESGRKGAETRWNRSTKPSVNTDGVAINSPIASASTPLQSSLGLTAAAEESRAIVAMAAAVNADAAETKDLERKPPERLGSLAYPESQKLIASCKKFSDVTPDFVEKLANLARAVEPNLDDGTLCDAIRATFKREKQESAGLWLVTVPAWLRNRKKATA